MPDRAQRMCSFSPSLIGADSSKYHQQTQQVSYAHLATLVILCCWWDVGNSPTQRRFSNYVETKSLLSLTRSLCNECPRTSKSNSILIQNHGTYGHPAGWRHISAPYRKVFSIILIPTRSSNHSSELSSKDCGYPASPKHVVLICTCTFPISAIQTRMITL